MKFIAFAAAFSLLANAPAFSAAAPFNTLFTCMEADKPVVSIQVLGSATASPAPVLKELRGKLALPKCSALVQFDLVERCFSKSATHSSHYATMLAMGMFTQPYNYFAEHHKPEDYQAFVFTPPISHTDFSSTLIKYYKYPQVVHNGKTYCAVKRSAFGAFLGARAKATETISPKKAKKSL